MVYSKKHTFKSNSSAQTDFDRPKLSHFQRSPITLKVLPCQMLAIFLSMTGSRQQVLLVPELLCKVAADNYQGRET